MSQLYAAAVLMGLTLVFTTFLIDSSARYYSALRYARLAYAAWALSWGLAIAKADVLSYYFAYLLSGCVAPMLLSMYARSRFGLAVNAWCVAASVTIGIVGFALPLYFNWDESWLVHITAVVMIIGLGDALLTLYMQKALITKSQKALALTLLFSILYIFAQSVSLLFLADDFSFSGGMFNIFWLVAMVAVAISINSSYLEEAYLETSKLLAELQIRSKELEAEIAVRKRAEATRLKLEQQLLQGQKLESLGVLAGGIAHDFNNILQAILGYCEIASDNVNKNSGRVINSLEMVKKAGLRAANLVSQILTFSRQAEMSMELVVLPLLIKESLQFIRSGLPATISIETEIDPECVPIMADPIQMHQIVTNLCTNAMHAMEESHGGVLKVSLGELNIDSMLSTLAGSIGAGNYLQLSVSDTGDGIAPDKIQRIVDPFYTTKDQGKGTGLGLSIVHGISGNMGGGMIVESEVGKGTTVRVMLPVGALDSVAEVHQAEEKAAASVQGHILLVDDELDLISLFSLSLEELGFTTDTYSEPEAALKAFEAKPEDFILAILDCTMPRMTGIQLAENIYAINPNIPVVLMTGHLGSAQIDFFHDLNIVETINKPFKMGSLINRLTESGVLRKP